VDVISARPSAVGHDEGIEPRQNTAKRGGKLGGQKESDWSLQGGTLQVSPALLRVPRKKGKYPIFAGIFPAGLFRGQTRGQGVSGT